MDSNQFREAARSSVDEIIDYNDTMVQRPVVSQVSPGYLAKLVPLSPPQSGEAWSAIQSDIETKIQPGLTHWQHPRFMAWFPASVTYPSILGEMFSAAFSSANFNWICSPAVTELETIMMDWVAQLLNLPDCFLSKGTGGGSIQGTASDALVTVMVASRERYLTKMLGHLPDGDEKEDAMAELRGKLVALGSEQAHSCTAKGAKIAGVRYRSIPTRFEDDLAMTAASVAKTIDELKAKGLHPFYLTSSIGTTGTCAVDEIGAIAEVLRANHGDVWHHIDAAWAGVSLCLPSIAEGFSSQLALVDSFETNLHKWGLVNLDAACLFVRRRRDLTDAFSMTPSYLRNDMSDSGLVTDYRDWGVPLGRRFRALKIWFVLRTYGINGFRAIIEKHLGMGDKFAALVRGRADIFEVVTKPAFALTALRCVPPDAKRGAGITNGEAGTTDLAETEGLAEAAGTAAAAANGISSQKMPPAAFQIDDDRLQAANALTKEVYESVNRDGEFFLTSTVANGVYVIRVVSANFNAEWKHLEQIFDKLVQVTERAIAEGRAEEVKKA